MNNSAQAIDALYKANLFSQVRLAREGNVLVVQVEEFPVIAEVKLKGNRDLKSEDLQKALSAAGITEGQAYNPQMLQQLVQELTLRNVMKGAGGVSRHGRRSRLASHKMA